MIVFRISGGQQICRQVNSIIFLFFQVKMKDNKGTLSNIRVLKKNMIFLQSYDQIIPTQTLKNSNTFTPCGKVQSVKTKQNYKNTTTYATFSAPLQAAVALIAFYHLNSRIRVLFGTMQYCKYFMRKAECRNETCVFLHVRDKKNQIIVNDQIDQTVYDDHYDMALKLIQDDNYLTVRSILNNTSIDDASLIKRGLKKFVQILNIELEPDEIPSLTVKQSQFFQQSTEQSQLTEGRDQVLQKNNSEVVQNTNKIQQNLNSQDFSSQDYIKIRLIKKLVREHRSKFNFDEGLNQQHISNRCKMILNQIVKY